MFYGIAGVTEIEDIFLYDRDGLIIFYSLDEKQELDEDLTNYQLLGSVPEV